MNIPIRSKSYRVLAILTLIIVFICSACATSGASSNSSSSTTRTNTITMPTTTPTRQSISKTHLLSGPITYVALGASDAVGVGSNRPGSQGYVPLIAAHLPKGSHMVNLGISGIRLHEALFQELPIALSTSPNLITIWLVANDFVTGVSYSDYINDLNTLLKQLHGNTHAMLVMANLPDLTRLPAFSDQTASQKAQMLQEIRQWNAGIAKLAAQYDVVVVDLFSQGSQLTAHPEYVSGDGFHPSPAGYVQLANLFWEAIEG